MCTGILRGRLVTTNKCGARLELSTAQGGTLRIGIPRINTAMTRGNYNIIIVMLLFASLLPIIIIYTFVNPSVLSCTRAHRARRKNERIILYDCNSALIKLLLVLFYEIVVLILFYFMFYKQSHIPRDRNALFPFFFTVEKKKCTQNVLLCFNTNANNEDRSRKLRNDSPENILF